MREILTYALGVVVCSALFVGFYCVALHRRVPFLAARIYLVASLMAAAVIPALDIPVWSSQPVELPTAFEFSTVPTTGTPVAFTPKPDLWPAALLAIYGVGIAALITIMIVQAAKIRRTKRRSEVYTSAGYEVAVSEEVQSPFSFLQTVYVTRGTPEAEMRQIILHESSHIHHRHSVEKIIMETLKTLLWYNPFAWIAARLLNEVHEFEADRDVLLGGCTVEEYLPVIFRQVFGYTPEISTGLGNSLTKKRFEMMTTKMKLTKHSALRVAGVLPLAAGMMMLFSFTERPAEIVYTPEPETTLTVQLPDMTNVIFWLSNENREMTKKEMDAINPDDIQSIDVLKETASLTPYLEKTGRKSADGVVLITMKSQNSDGGIPLFNAEVMPKFQGGGLTEFRKWVSERLVYPKEAQDGNITGKVTVRFIIEKDGSLTNIEEIASPSKLLTDEVARVLRQSPKWSPGMQGGKPVRIFYILPIDFSLKGATKTAGAPVKIALPEKSEVTIDELYVVAYGADATETTTVTINSAKKDGGSIGVTGTPMDKLFIWLEGENRELTLAQMNAISGDDISKVSVIRNGEYPENITRAMGDRKFEGAVLITLK